MLADGGQYFVKQPVLEFDGCRQLAGYDEAVHVTLADEPGLLRASKGVGDGVAFHDPTAMPTDRVVCIRVSECGCDVTCAVFDRVPVCVDADWLVVECVGGDVGGHGGLLGGVWFVFVDPCAHGFREWLVAPDDRELEALQIDEGQLLRASVGGDAATAFVRGGDARGA